MTDTEYQAIHSSPRSQQAVGRQIHPLLISLICLLTLTAGCAKQTENRWLGKIEVIYGVQQINSDGPIYHSPDTTLQVIMTPDLVIKGQGTTADASFASTYGLTTDKSGNIYLADSDQSRILKYAEDGRFLKAVGSNGSGPLNFKKPTDLAINAKNQIIIVDTELNRVTTLNEDFTLADIWDTPVVRPRRVRVDSEGNVLVFAITQHDLIYKFSPDGKFLQSFFDPKAMLRVNGNLDQLIAYSDAAMETSMDGYVYLSSRHPYRIQKFDRVSGLALQFSRTTPFDIVPLSSWSGNQEPPPVGISGALAVFPGGRILNIIQYQEFTRAGIGYLGQPDLKLTKVERWFDFFNAEGKWELTSKIDVAGFPMHVDSKGRIYFAEAEPPRIVRYTVQFPKGVD